MCKRPYRLKLLFLLLSLSYQLHVAGQTITIEGVILSTDETPIGGATIEYEEGKGVSADAKGVFKLELAEQPSYTLKVRSIGYVELDTTVQIEGPSTYVVIQLEEQVYTQPEVVVTEDVNTVFERKEWQVQDFRVHQDRIYVLYWLNNRKHVLLANLRGIQLDEMDVENGYAELYTSCSGRLYLKGKAGLVEIGEQDNELAQLGKPISPSDFEKFMFPCFDKLAGNFLFKRYQDHNKRLHYFTYNEEKKAELIYEIFDREAYKSARRSYNRIIGLYHRSVSAPGGTGISEGIPQINIIARGEWNGDLMELILNNEIQFAVSYYQNIEARELDAYEFSHGEQLYILDKLKKEVLRYHGSTKKLQKVKVDPAINWKKLNEVLLDAKEEKVYLSMGKRGLYELEIGEKRLSVKSVKELEKSWLDNQNAQIYDGALYYFSQPNITKFQTVFKKESIGTE